MLLQLFSKCQGLPGSFFPHKCKSPHQNEENGVKWQFDSSLMLMFLWPMITLLAELITLIFPWKVGKEEVTLPTYSKSFDLLFIPHAHVLYSNPYSITKQMAATSISCSDFENIIDSMFSKLRQSASHVFRKIRRCTLIWYGFCFGFNHVLSRFYLRERIHNPVSVSRCALNGVLYYETDRFWI